MNLFEVLNKEKKIGLKKKIGILMFIFKRQVDYILSLMVLF